MKLEVAIFLDGKEISRSIIPVNASTDPDRPELPVQLTPTEIKVSKMVTQSMSSRDIAHELNVTTNYIENVRSSVRNKLNLNRSQALTQELAKYQLPPIPD